MSDAVAGAKLALIGDGCVLAMLRDDFAHIPYPDTWDLPGGAREGTESAPDCVLRELHEEFGLRMAPDRLIWRRDYASADLKGARVAFFGGMIRPGEVAAIRFGTEGQRWEMMPIARFLSHDRAVPYLQSRLRDWLATM